MRIVARLDQRAFAVVIDQEVVRVPGQQEFGCLFVLQLDRVAAIAMQDRADEVRAIGPQRHGLRLGGVDGGGKAQVLGEACGRCS